MMKNYKKVKAAEDLNESRGIKVALFYYKIKKNNYILKTPFKKEIIENINSHIPAKIIVQENGKYIERAYINNVEKFALLLRLKISEIKEKPLKKTYNFDAIQERPKHDYNFMNEIFFIGADEMK